MRRAAGVACAMALVAALAGACTDDDGGSTTNDPIGTKDDPVQLSFMTYGPDDEASAPAVDDPA